MLVVNRFRVEEFDQATFPDQLARARSVLAACAGYVEGSVGRNVDDPAIWLLMTRWQNVGSYRRALSSYDVKVHAVAILARAIDEPSAYEVVTGNDVLNKDLPRSLD